MGGLKRHMPTTYWTFVVATLALAGIPVFAGFFSKDEILGKVFAAGAGNLSGYGTVYLVLWVLGLAGAFMTAFYMFRLVHMTFHGEFRGTHEQAHHLHESPKTHDRAAAGARGRLDPRRLPRGRQGADVQRRPQLVRGVPPPRRARRRGRGTTSRSASSGCSSPCRSASRSPASSSPAASTSALAPSRSPTDSPRPGRHLSPRRQQVLRGRGVRGHGDRRHDEARPRLVGVRRAGGRRGRQRGPAPDGRDILLLGPVRPQRGRRTGQPGRQGLRGREQGAPPRAVRASCRGTRWSWWWASC